MRYCLDTRGGSANSAQILAIRRKCALRPGVGTSAAKALHSAAKRMHVSACFWTFSDSNTALLLKGGSTCLSQSSAGQMDGADAGVKVGTSGVLSGSYFPNLRARSRHHRPPKADPSRQRPSKHDKPRGRIAEAVNATAKQ